MEIPSQDVSSKQSVRDLTNAVLYEWAKIRTDTIQSPVESLPRRVEAVIAPKVPLINININININAYGFRMGSHKISCRCNG